MALIKCPECDTEVSDRADQCPKCAYPLGTKNEKPQVIEQTSKRLKLQLLIGVLIVIIAFPAGFLTDSSVVSISLIVIGLVVGIWAQVSIWWHHH